MVRLPWALVCVLGVETTFKSRPAVAVKLFTALIADGRETCVFPIGEYWTDIGKIDDFERANREFSGNFERAKDAS